MWYNESHVKMELSDMGKFYAVRAGHQVGIFNTWAECQTNTKGFSGAIYKSFTSLTDAQAFMDQSKPTAASDYQGLVAYVDGSYNIATGDFGSGIVLLCQGAEISTHSLAGTDETLASMRNVAGEIKGSQWAIEYALANGHKEIQIHYDYEGVEKWALGTWKANKEGTIAYQQFCKSVEDKITVYFVKVKAHSGDLYNDKADLLAKAACGV